MITKNPASRSLVVRPAGNLDALTAEHYRQYLRPLFDEGYLFVIFDLEETEYVTSAGLGLLVEIHNRLASNEGRLRLVHCGEIVTSLLKQTKLDTIFETDQSEGSTESVPLDALHELMSDEILVSARINEVAERALAADDPKEIATHVLESVAAICRSDRAAFYFIHREEERLELGAHLGLEESVQSSAAEILIGGCGIEESILAANRIESVSSSVKTKGNPAATLLGYLGFSSAVLIPIHGMTESHALVVVQSENLDESAMANARPLLGTFASICGLALEKMNLLHQLQAQNHDLQATLRVVQKFQNTLVDVGKLAALGTVISGLGHMLNNKLVPIIGYTQMLRESPALPEKPRQQMQVVNEAAIELRNVMEKLIKVSRVREMSHDLVDVNELLNKTVTLLGHHIDCQEVSIRFCLSDELPMIIADHDLLLQGFVAAIHRACSSFEAEHEDRWILIVTSNRGSSIEITIEDNGKGLGEMTPEQWLDPLVPFTELDQGKLFNYAIPRSVIKRHKGTLELTDKPEGGSIVRIDLPITRTVSTARTAPDSELADVEIA